ncbi:ribonuclease domain-containing protein [Neolewinella persica]|uniref:ribonuclease domain-containing protein n=1 Tax=Neolewinella persica TaxID=70998 RepID=UPI00039B0E70|nr:ribonuclease domain-containing protein [Neolewinella persica]
MLTLPKPSSHQLPGALILCLLTLLLFTSLRTCAPAQITQLPAVKTTVPIPKPPRGNIDPALPVLALAQSPPHVQRVVQHLRTIKSWNPLAGFRGGRTFRNLEGVLPKRAVYREYDVLPNLAGVPRGAERIVVDATRRNFYYTSDHYTTFTQILLP